MAARALLHARRACTSGLLHSAWKFSTPVAACPRPVPRHGIRALASTVTPLAASISDRDGSTEAGDCFRASYAQLLKSGLRPDKAQQAAVDVLARVGDDVAAATRDAHSAGPLSRLLHASGLRPAPPVCGAYIAGGVGSGKTMLAELLYSCVSDGARKKQQHFHAFVLDVHARLHAKRGARAADKIGDVARDIADETGFLLLDEFQVTDISDAVVVHHLFRRLFEHGVVVVATSNRVPERLYENGLQRELFLPVVPLIRKYCRVHVMDSTHDYRLRNGRADRRVFFRDKHGGADALEDVFDALAEDFPVREARIDVLGRKLVVPMAVADRQLAYFTFEQLCNRPLSAADYIELCNVYHTICVADVPVLDVIADRNASRRLTRFIDAAYRVGTKVVIHAAAPIEQLFLRPSEHTVQTEEAFETYRIQSRLFEMQTDEYLERAWTPDSDDEYVQGDENGNAEVDVGSQASKSS